MAYFVSLLILLLVDLLVWLVLPWGTSSTTYVPLQLIRFPSFFAIFLLTLVFLRNHWVTVIDILADVICRVHLSWVVCTLKVEEDIRVRIYSRLGCIWFNSLVPLSSLLHTLLDLSIHHSYALFLANLPVFFAVVRIIVERIIWWDPYLYVRERLKGFRFQVFELLDLLHCVCWHR